MSYGKNVLGWKERTAWRMDARARTRTHTRTRTRMHASSMCTERSLRIASKQNTDRNLQGGSRRQEQTGEAVSSGAQVVSLDPRLDFELFFSLLPDIPTLRTPLWARASTWQRKKNAVSNMVFLDHYPQRVIQLFHTFMHSPSSACCVLICWSLWQNKELLGIFGMLP